MSDVIELQSLDELKAELKYEIDDTAEIYRLNFVTPGSGQALAYATKEAEARSLLAGGPAGPHLVAEAAVRGVTPEVIAEQVVMRADAWAQMSARIEAERLRVKAAIDAAPNVRVARIAFNSVVWPE